MIRKYCFLGWIWALVMLPVLTVHAAAPTVRLNDGRQMPVLGLGTWTLGDAAAENMVYHAIKCGYRLIDTAQYYGNESGVGRGARRAIRDGLVHREDLFITTKIAPWGSGGYDEAIRASNDRLGLGYIDLMLIHQRGQGEKELYAAMERAIDAGILRSLGISNYYTPQEYDHITANARIMPAIIQNENHLYYQNTALQKYVARHGTIVESYYPLGGRGHTRIQFSDATVQQLASRYGKTPAQILLRWHVQAGYVAIPGSNNAEHIAENMEIFDFAFTQEEMNALAALDTGKRYESW